MLANLVTQGNADDPFITDDGLQMFFENSATTLGKDQQLFVAVRASTSVEFASGQILANVNDPAFSDSAASVTSDALTMVFNSTRAGSSDLYIATRPSASSAFGAPVALSFNTPGFECCSSLAGDGSSMVLVSDQSGTQRISLSLRGGADYLPPTTLDPLLAGATGDEVDPTLTRDGTTIVFSSNRAGGTGGYDIYLAERSCR
ncbi:MAG: TolB family protein [Acidobacteriota bacterium]